MVPVRSPLQKATAALAMLRLHPGAGPVDLVAKNVIPNNSPDVASGKNKNTSDHTGVLFFPNAAHIDLPHRFFNLFALAWASGAPAPGLIPEPHPLSGPRLPAALS